MCDSIIVGRWQWRPLSTSHFSFSQTFTKPQNAAWHCWCPSQTLCALLPGASPVAVSLPALGPLALPHPTHRAGGAGAAVLGPLEQWLLGAGVGSLASLPPVLTDPEAQLTPQSSLQGEAKGTLSRTLPQMSPFLPFGGLLSSPLRVSLRALP